MKTLTVAKHRYTKGWKAKDRALAHLQYIQNRPGEDKEAQGGRPRMFFDGRRDEVPADEIARKVHESFARDKGQALMHKLTLSPGINGLDMQEYIRELMTQLGRYKGLDLDWDAIVHKNTDHEHVHVVIQNHDKDGRLVRFDKHEYQLLREWGDRYLEREIEPLDRYNMRAKIEEPADVMKLLDDRYYRFGDWKFQKFLKDLHSGDSAKDAREEEEREGKDRNDSELEEEERKRREREEDERRWQQEREEASRLQLKFEEECQRTFSRRRRMGSDQFLHESRGRLLEWHERYEVQKMRERLSDQMERDPERAGEIKEQLEWLDTLDDRKPLAVEEKAPDDKSEDAVERPPSNSASGERTEAAQTGQAAVSEDSEVRRQDWEVEAFNSATELPGSADRELFDDVAAKFDERLSESSEERGSDEQKPSPERDEEPDHERSQ
jgi:hypothetical protein